MDSALKHGDALRGVLSTERDTIRSKIDAELSDTRLTSGMLG
jgi:hypothetical protein